MTDADWTRAVCEEPSDDAVRLVYADWLEEQGRTERAEFIRVQVELWSWDGINTGMDGGAAGPEHLALLRRERELFTHPDVVLATMIVLPGWSFRHTPFIRRGFLSHIEITLADFMDHAADLFAAAPLESVRLTDQEPEYADRDPGFSSWYWPDLPNCLYPSGWFPIVEAAHAALSARCVAYGRELAGLSALRNSPCRT